MDMVIGPDRIPRQDSLTLCFRSDCPKHQNRVAEGCQTSRDNGVPTDAYMYGRSRLKDSYDRVPGYSIEYMYNSG